MAKRNKKIFIYFLLFSCLLIIVTIFNVIQLVLSSSVIDEQNVDLNDDYISEWDADDPRLIEHIRKYYLYSPAPRNTPYNLDNPNRRYWSESYQSKYVETLFKNKMNGYFLECGALDGEIMSNTLSFEVYYNWTGLLIEPDNKNLKKLLNKKRKSWVVHGCLHKLRKPEKVAFYGASALGTVSSYMTLARKLLVPFYSSVHSQTAWCFNLESILLAVNRTHVDYFSLDVEGPEIEILEGINFKKVNVTVMQIEFARVDPIFVNQDVSKQRKEEIRSIMKRFPGYRETKQFLYDIIFVKNTTLPVVTPLHTLDNFDAVANK